MAVRITKSAVNIREKLAELERPIGVNGAALMKTETPQEAFSLINAGRKNIVHNGEFKISQRGTSVSSMGIDTRGPCDRWFQWAASGTEEGRSTWSKEDADATLRSLAGVGYYLKVDVTTAESSLGSSEAYAINQRIEGQDVQYLQWGTGGAKSVTVSFWVKADNATGTYCFALLTNNGSSTNSYIKEYQVTSNWTKVSFTIPGNTSIRPVNTNTDGFALYWSLMTGSGRQGTANVWGNSSAWATSNQTNLFASTSNNFYLAGVQVEVGKVATEFEYRTYADELRLCQRYLPAINSTGSGYVDVGYIQASNQMNTIYHFLVPTRTAPTGMTVNNIGSLGMTTQSAGGTWSSVTFNNSTVTSAQWTVTMTASSWGSQINYMAFWTVTGSGQILFTGCEL